MKIQPIVEGHGEVEALPVLLRRLIDEAQVWTVGVGRPIRRPRTRLVQEEGVTQAVRLALEQPQCGAVLVLFDGNSDCPAELGPSVEAWATAAADDIPCRVVRAHREYEAWFLAAIESLRGSRGIRTDAQPHPGAGTSSRRQGATGHVHAGGRALSGDGRPGGTERDVFVVCRPSPVPVVPQARRLVWEPRSSHGARHRRVAAGCVDREWVKRSATPDRPHIA